LVDASFQFSISFNTISALSTVDGNKGPDIKVSNAERWAEGSKQQLTRLIGEEKIDITIQPGKEFDWTYTPNYLGTVTSEKSFENTTEPINIAMLQQPVPILFFDDIVLFEDELADNGSAVLSVKFRVMSTCFLVLLRYFLRVDGVVFRVYDTRLFHDFKKNYLIRDYQQKEGEYNAVVKTIEDNEKARTVTDPNIIDKYLTLKQNRLEKILFK